MVIIGSPDPPAPELSAPAARLSPTSFLLLGLIAAHGPCTPYDLKSLVVERLAGLWTVPHSQLYQEPDRLCDHGLLDRHTEDSGRRRKLFRITATGDAALRTWLARDDPPGWEVRDTHLLRLALLVAVDRRDLVGPLAKHRREHHQQRIDELRTRLGDDGGEPVTPVADDLAGRYALRLEIATRDFWSELADDAP